MSTFAPSLIACSPDGKTLALAGTHEVGLWNAETGEPIGKFDLEGRGYLSSLGWSADGALYAGGERHAVLKLSPQSCAVEAELRGHTGVVRSLSPSADGSRMATAGDEEAIVWSLPEGKIIRTISLSERALDGTAALSPDGKRIVIPGDRRRAAAIIDVDTGNIAVELVERVSDFPRFAFTSDGRYLLGGGRKDPVRIWEAETGRLVFSTATKIRADTLFLSRDGRRFATTSEFGTIEILSIPEGKPIVRCVTMKVPPHGATFGRDGMLYAGSESGTIHRWNFSGAKPGPATELWSDHLESATWTSQNQIVTIGGDGEVRDWNAGTGRLEQIRSRASSEVELKTDPRPIAAYGRLIAGVTGRRIQTYDKSTGRELLKVDVPSEARSLIGIDGAGLQAAAVVEVADRLRAVLCLSLDGSRRHTFAIDRRNANTAAFTPDGRRLVVGFDQATTTEKWTPPDRVAFSGGILRPLTYGHEPTLYVFDVETGRELFRFGNELKSVSRLAISPSSRLLAVRDLDGLTIWDLEKNERLAAPKPLHISDQPLLFSPDERRLLCGSHSSKSTFDLCEVATMSPIEGFGGRNVWAEDAAFSPDGRRLFSRGLTEYGTIWDALAPSTESHPAGQGSRTFESLWEQLASGDGRTGYGAVRRYVDSGDEAIAFLNERVSAVPTPEPAKIARFIEDLDSERFAVREQASKELAVYGDSIEEILRARIRNEPSLERRERLQALLAGMRGAEALRVGRVVAALEHSGSPAARAMLARLAAGEPRASLTRDAARTLARLAAQSSALSPTGSK
jgi:WD40 repeat protein